ncbi:MAG: hypothetical protein Alpg2KO_12360 [Alphaproteobacteria bacterium]
MKRYLGRSPVKSEKRHSRGATLLEYAVLVGLVSVIALVTITTVGGNTQSLFGGVSDSLEGAASSAGAGAGEDDSGLTIPPFPTTADPGGSVVTVTIPGDLGPGPITVTSGGDAEVGDNSSGPFGGSVSINPGDSIAISLPADEPGQTYTGNISVPGIGTVSVSVTIGGATGASYQFHQVFYSSGVSTSGYNSVHSSFGAALSDIASYSVVNTQAMSAGVGLSDLFLLAVVDQGSGVTDYVYSNFRPTMGFSPLPDLGGALGCTEAATYGISRNDGNRLLIGSGTNLRMISLIDFDGHVSSSCAARQPIPPGFQFFNNCTNYSHCTGYFPIIMRTSSYILRVSP